MCAKRCPYLVRVCPKGIKCKLLYDGRVQMDGDINRQGNPEFTWYDSESKMSGAGLFASIYCKNAPADCRLYQENIVTSVPKVSSKQSEHRSQVKVVYSSKLHKLSVKVLLNGTCNSSTWRDLIIPELKIDYINPYVKGRKWTTEQQELEIKQRDSCDLCLYVITPLMHGMYSIFELADDSNKRPQKTIMCYLETDIDSGGHIVKFSDFQLITLQRIAKDVKSNGGTYCKTLDDVVAYLNSFA